MRRGGVNVIAGAGGEEARVADRRHVQSVDVLPTVRSAIRLTESRKTAPFFRSASTAVTSNSLASFGAFLCCRGCLAARPMSCAQRSRRASDNPAGHHERLPVTGRVPQSARAISDVVLALRSGRRV